MKQIQIKSIGGLLAQSAKAIGGAAQYGAELLTVNTEVLISADRDGLVTSNGQYETGKNGLASKQAVVVSVTSTTRKFILNTRKVLEDKLGSRYSAAWDVVGFKGSLKVPHSLDGVLVLAERVSAYLRAKPEAQVSDLGITPDHGDGLVTDLKTAQAARNKQRTDVKLLLAARKTAEAALLKRLQNLFMELRMKLGPLDPRWLAFGWNMPGAKNIPSVPDNVTAVLVGDTAAAVKWDASERAEYYRVWKRVVGVDTEFVAAGSPVDRDFTIEGLPRNATIELVISAVNSGGESGKSTVVTVTTH